MKRIALCSDHAGFELKQKLRDYLLERGFVIKDFGTFSEESCDYPDFAHPMSYSIESGAYDFGISLCGSGNGISMTANKHQGIRSALCWLPELARLARLHNDANVCSLPARFISFSLAQEIVDVFLSTGFEGARHVARINKMGLKDL